MIGVVEILQPGGFWDEPGDDYFQSAMDELRVTYSELETVRPGHERGSTPRGNYPVLDRVYAKAWELRASDEAEMARNASSMRWPWLPWVVLGVLLLLVGIYGLMAYSMRGFDLDFLIPST